VGGGVGKRKEERKKKTDGEGSEIFHARVWSH